jgi:nucleoside-diphosphate-sugar epimerase
MSFHVVVGAGATGIATAELLADSGDRVRLITRRGTGPARPGIERIAADATDPDRLTELTEGALTLFQCAAPPYHRWPAEFPPLAAALLTAAERTSAGYVMLGNLYGYGPVDGPLTEDLPLAATTVKGRVRAQLWHDALAAHQAGRVRVTEVRASTFIGPGAVSVFTLMVESQVLAGQPAVVAADLDAAHSWTYTGDVARTLVAVSQDDRTWGRPWHVPSGPAVSIRELAERLAEAAGAPTPKLRVLTTDELTALGEADPIMKELPEMHYLHDQPLILDSSQTEQTFGLKPTPLDEVLALRPQRVD